MTKLWKMFGAMALLGLAMTASGCGGGSDAPAPMTNPSVTAPIGGAVVNATGTATTGATATTVAPAASTTGYLGSVTTQFAPSTVITAKNADGTVKPLTTAPSLTFTAPADSTPTFSGTYGVPEPPGSSLVSTAGAVKITLTGAPAATFNPAMNVTMPVPGKAVGAVITVHSIKEGTTAYALLGNFTVTTAGFLTFPVSDLCWQVGRAPLVISTSPADGATGVPVNSNLTATFNEAMNPATITVERFFVKGPGEAPVSGTVTYANGTATFTPAGSLTAGVTYTATVAAEVENEAHNKLTRGSDGLESKYVWTFTTASPAPPPPTGSTGGTTL